jgi:hypothetical protein
MRSRTGHVSREPLDRRRLRVIQALLAFPVAGIIGFAGSTIVRGLVSEDTSVAAPPTPGHPADETPPREREEPQAQPVEDSSTIRIA